jgi:hypothetical protein
MPPGTASRSWRRIAPLEQCPELAGLELRLVTTRVMAAPGDGSFALIDAERHRNVAMGNVFFAPQDRRLVAALRVESLFPPLALAEVRGISGRTLATGDSAIGLVSRNPHPSLGLPQGDARMMEATR